MFHNNLTEKLKQYLRSINVTEDKVNEYLVILTQSTKKSLIQIEQEEFLKIAIAIKKDKYHHKLFKDLSKKFREKESLKFGYQTHSQEYERLFERTVQDIKDKISPNIYKLIQKHYEKYFYVAHMWVGEVSSFEHYLKELVRIIGSGANLETSYKNAQKDFILSLKKRQTLLKKLNIKAGWKSVFDGFGDFMVTKIYRRFAQIYAIYKMEYILSEIAKRLGLSLKEVRFMLPYEVKNALSSGRINKKEIKARTKFCVYYAEKGASSVFLGQKAKGLASKTKVEVKDTSEISGQTGCIGKASGIVKKIFRPSDMEKMKKGDILVSIATNPDIVPAMRKAAAIITDQGGVTSHAAIVSRELGIPCVIGTKIATRVLKDGDRVEVDATKGLVKKV
jgi:phosphoenolpyruvate synthase/pyruvate phosphate dikinase